MMATMRFGRFVRMEQVTDEFFTCVTTQDVAASLPHLDPQVIDVIHSYWVLKRRVRPTGCYVVPDAILSIR